ncbi:MAG TPA: 2-amino-4-hydroxy-6-hydroxymethyldihydropteridine diphosphokinase [Rhodospirillaceae bacterium]|nr:2-amino-4-hydroxy-6-hydroxymethyldihydropteridine diphosphokinase [Rhodospirillaceae bacterium]
MDKTHTFSTVCLALGANLGDRLAALKAAREALEPFVEILDLSSVYETTPAYVMDQPLFLNAALLGKTKFDPRGLLYSVKNVELEIGRKPTFRYGPRVIDIDIIFYGDEVMKTPELTLPHDSIAERSFVLRPLTEIASDWVHPVLGKSARDLLNALPDKADPRIIAESF